jgi:hypothetical protein
MNNRITIITIVITALLSLFLIILYFSPFATDYEDSWTGFDSDDEGIMGISASAIASISDEAVFLDLGNPMLYSLLFIPILLIGLSCIPKSYIALCVLSFLGLLQTVWYMGWVDYLERDLGQDIYVTVFPRLTVAIYIILMVFYLCLVVLSILSTMQSKKGAPRAGVQRKA